MTLPGAGSSRPPARWEERVRVGRQFAPGVPVQSPHLGTIVEDLACSPSPPLWLCGFRGVCRYFYDGLMVPSEAVVPEQDFHLVRS